MRPLLKLRQARYSLYALITFVVIMLLIFPFVIAASFLGWIKGEIPFLSYVHYGPIFNYRRCSAIKQKVYEIMEKKLLEYKVAWVLPSPKGV